MEPSVAGARVLSMRDVIHARHGASVVDKALTHLDPAQAGEYRSVTTLSWLPSRIDYAVHDAIARELGKEPEAFHQDVLREAMERSFKTLWKIFLRMTSDEALIARTPAIYKRTRNTGEMTSRVVAPGRAEIVLGGYPGFTARDARSLCVGLEVVLRLTGRKNAALDVQEVRSDGARWIATWS